jgi:peptide/nickel transport system substrate-binding protein
MSRYAAKAVAVGQRSPGFNNTGRWKVPAEYAEFVRQLGNLDLSDTKAITDVVVNAYRILDKQTPFVPLVQSPKIIPFNTTYWTGWPTAAGWLATHRIIHRLKRS